MVFTASAQHALRVLLDTNIYGFICDAQNPQIFVDEVFKWELLICGSTVIRRELRRISKRKVVGRLKTRALALDLYDRLVGEKRNYAVSELVKSIARKYYSQYRGLHAWSEIENDFLIVATASLHNVDVVISGDERTLVSEYAIQAYKTVNASFKLRVPSFLKFDEFKRLITLLP